MSNYSNKCSKPNKRSSLIGSQRLLLFAALSLPLFACNASDEPVSNKGTKLDVKTLQVVNNETVVPKQKTVEKMTQAEQINDAKKHLASKLNIDTATISLAGVESVTWRSGAMGCPEPGMVYTQALVPGKLIMLKVGKKAYRYHSSPEGSPFYCSNARAESPSARPDDI